MACLDHLSYFCYTDIAFVYMYKLYHGRSCFVSEKKTTFSNISNNMFFLILFVLPENRFKGDLMALLPLFSAFGMTLGILCLCENTTLIKEILQ